MSSLLALLLILPNTCHLSPPQLPSNLVHIDYHLWVRIPIDAPKGVACLCWNSIIVSHSPIQLYRR